MVPLTSPPAGKKVEFTRSWYQLHRRLFVSPDGEAFEEAGAEGGGDGDVGGVTAAGHQDAAAAGSVVARIEGVPGAAEIDLEPGGKVRDAPGYGRA